MTTGFIGNVLRRLLRGEVWTAGDDGYDDARRVWNAAVDRRPAVVARCADADDVVTAVRAAREHGVPLSVRGGGHDWAGRALRDGGVVLDLSALRGVRVDPGARTADAGGGALTADVVDAAAAHALGLPTGLIRDVGMAGLTMAGGYGPLTGHFGLALDNLLAADVVLADGRQVTAGPDGDEELLWALRGGGGNFGVVTAARYRLHPLGPVLGGMVMYPLEAAADVLTGYREVVAGAPDELTVTAGFLTGPAGTPVVFVAPTWSGDLTEGEAAVAPLRRLGRPLVDAVAPQPYAELLRMFEPGIVRENHNALGTRWLPDLAGEHVAALAEGAATMPSPFSLLALHRFHGAASRVPVDATAFALRRDHLLAEVIGVWPPDGDADAARAWVGRVTDALEPGSLPGGYPNILEPSQAARVELGFGPHAGRLAAAKRRYDPEGAFTAVAALPV